MTMTPDQLRALADTLSSGTHFVESPELHEAMMRAADYLRAQADAQPVAWMWQHDETGRIGFVDQYQVEAGWQELNPRCELVHKLYTRPAPAAPQAEPTREPTCLWSRADDDTDVWETSCGHAFTIIDGTPGDNNMEFCCYCGRPLEQEIGGSDVR